MREMLTDELLNELADDYYVAKTTVEKIGGTIITFEQYVKEEMQLRAWNLRKGGIRVEI